MWRRFLFLLFCFSSHAQGQNVPEDWEARVLEGQMLFSSSIPEDGFFPPIGNGFISGDVGCVRGENSQGSCGSLYMAGVFNGYANITPSHRAVLPGFHSFFVSSTASQQVSYTGGALDVQFGTFYNRTVVSSPSCNNISIQQTFYAHQLYRNLLVYQVSALNLADGEECTVFFESCNLNSSSDMALAYPVSPDENVTLLVATNLISELPILPNTVVGAAALKVPLSLTFSTTQPSSIFLAVLHSNLEQGLSTQEEVLQAAEMDLETFQTIDSAALFESHAEAWLSTWVGGIEIAGNLTVGASINSSLYYIMSAARPDFPFGISPGGLARDSYNGHHFWDCETWMFPSLVFLNPSLAESFPQYRINRLQQAQIRAQQRGWSGAMFPWESAVTGCDCVQAPNPEGEIEQHINGDIVMALRLYYMGVQNDSWLEQTAWPLVSNVCSFFASRVVRYQGNGNYTILNVQPPDESAGKVNSSVYTNAIASTSLQFCVWVSQRLNFSVPSNWSEIAANMYIPVVDYLYREGPVHPEYGGYLGEPINQADVALLQYPLKYPMPLDIAINDLLYYQSRTSGPTTSGFYTGDSSYSIAWLALQNRTAADDQFQLAFLHMDLEHYNIWTEKTAQLQFGHLNFITGAGGYLQNFLFGYAGLSPQLSYDSPFSSSSLNFSPQLPPNGITAVKLRGLAFVQSRFNVLYDNTTLTVELVSGPILYLTDSSGEVHPLSPLQPLSLSRQSFSIYYKQPSHN